MGTKNKGGIFTSDRKVFAAAQKHGIFLKQGTADYLGNLIRVRLPRS